MDYLQYGWVVVWMIGEYLVLNLVINGLHSIHISSRVMILSRFVVLNLVINGLPSIHRNYAIFRKVYYGVLNLVINGLPSILIKKNQIS